MLKFFQHFWNVIHSHFNESHTKSDSHIPPISDILLSSENRRDVEHLAANYENSIYKQLMDVMARLDAVEDDLNIEKVEHREDDKNLNYTIDHLTRENNLLPDDNARLKSIINNDSANTSLPPSTDQKGNKPSNTYNVRENTDRKRGGQKGHTGITLTKESIKERIKSGICRHEIRTLVIHPLESMLRNISWIWM